MTPTNVVNSKSMLLGKSSENINGSSKAKFTAMDGGNSEKEQKNNRSVITIRITQNKSYSDNYISSNILEMKNGKFKDIEQHDEPELKVISNADLRNRYDLQNERIVREINLNYQKNLDKGDFAKCLSFIKKYPSLIDIQNRRNEIFLTLVGKSGDTQIFMEFRKLIKNWDERQKLLEIKDGNGYTPLMYAVDGGHLELVRQMLRVNDPVRLIQAVNPSGKTVLMSVLEKCNLENVNQDSDCEDSDDDHSGYNYIKNLKILTILLGQIKNLESDLPRCIKCSENDSATILSEILMKTTNDGSTVLMAAIENEINIEKILDVISNQTDRQKLIKIKNKSNHSVFHAAVNGGSAKAIKILLDNLPDARDAEDLILFEDNNICSPLEYAVRCHRRRLVLALLSGIRDPQRRLALAAMERDKNLTNLMLAVQTGSNEIIKMLLDPASSPDGRTDLIAKTRADGSNSLMIAAKDGWSSKTLAILLGAIESPQRKEEVIKAKKLDGMDVVMIAVESGNLKSVKMLLEAVSNPKRILLEEDLDGYSAKAYANRSKNQEMIALLKSFQE